MIFTNCDDLNDLECAYLHWHSIGEIILFELINTSKTFCRDDFYRLARPYEMPPEMVEELSTTVFREFEFAKYIRKTGKMILSKYDWSNGKISLWESAPDS